MAARVGIELSPVACRIVEIEGGRRRDPAPPTRVRSYAVLPAGSQDMLEKLAGLRGREAAVVVWGVRSEHHQVFVPERRYDQMREDALELARDAGADTTGMLADIAPSGASQKGNRPVLLAMASSDALSIALRPILDAGVRVRSVTTPAGALASLARLRRGIMAPQPIEAYVVLEETATALAIARDGELVAARELPWGFLEGAGTREELATRLLEEIAGLSAGVGVASRSIGQILICGGARELRSLAAVMTERLDVEVEPLDSLFEIDSAYLPEPADDFRDRSTDLRLAWAAAADWIAPIDLVRYRNRQRRRAAFARAAVVAGVGAGLGAGWLVTRSGWWQAPVRIARAAPPHVVARVVPPAVLPPPKPLLPLVSSPPPPSVSQPLPPAPPHLPTALPHLPLATVRSVVPPPLPPAPPPALLAPLLPALPTVGQQAARVSPPPIPPSVTGPARPVVPLPAAAASTARREPLPPPVTPLAPIIERPVAASRVAAPPVAVPQVRVPQARAPQVSVPLDPAPPIVARPQAPRSPGRERPTPAPRPFDAVLGTILFSADRKLAIIDGHIVGIGEDVKGARVVDITPTVVTLRDVQGRIRTLTLASPSP